MYLYTVTLATQMPKFENLMLVRNQVKGKNLIQVHKVALKFAQKVGHFNKALSKNCSNSKWIAI